MKYLLILMLMICSLAGADKLQMIMKDHHNKKATLKAKYETMQGNISKGTIEQLTAYQKEVMRKGDLKKANDIENYKKVLMGDVKPKITHPLDNVATGKFPLAKDLWDRTYQYHKPMDKGFFFYHVKSMNSDGSGFMWIEISGQKTATIGFKVDAKGITFTDGTRISNSLEITFKKSGNKLQLQKKKAIPKKSFTRLYE